MIYDIDIYINNRYNIIKRAFSRKCHELSYCFYTNQGVMNIMIVEFEVNMPGKLSCITDPTQQSVMHDRLTYIVQTAMGCLASPCITVADKYRQ